jgi:hypothetical protein
MLGGRSLVSFLALVTVLKLRIDLDTLLSHARGARQFPLILIPNDPSWHKVTIVGELLFALLVEIVPSWLLRVDVIRGLLFLELRLPDLIFRCLWIWTMYLVRVLNFLSIFLQLVDQSVFIFLLSLMAKDGARIGKVSVE